MKRTVIAGVPRAGKSTRATALAVGRPLRRTDDLMRSLEWSAASEHVARDWMAAPGPWVIEGVAAVRALRKWLRAHPSGKPCDEVVWLDEPLVETTPGQDGLAKGCRTIWAEVEPELRARGVDVVSGRTLAEEIAVQHTRAGAVVEAGPEQR